MHNNQCPLCRSDRTQIYFCSRSKNLFRDYFRCQLCDLIFVPKRFHLDSADQKIRYLQHNNSPQDTEYRRFLSRLRDALKPHLNLGANGIDYGSGPGPTLSVMLQEDGFAMHTYDIFFQPDRSVLDKHYDFITCSETIEHFAQPGEEFQSLNIILKPDGWLGIMTSMLNHHIDFTKWHYIRDPTHVAFYTVRTMRSIADMFGWKTIFPCENVVLFQKQS